MYEYPILDIDVYDEADIGQLGLIISGSTYLLGCQSIDCSLLMLSIRYRLL